MGCYGPLQPGEEEHLENKWKCEGKKNREQFWCKRSARQQGGSPAEVVLVGLPGTGFWRSPLSSRRVRTRFKTV